MDKSLVLFFLLSCAVGGVFAKKHGGKAKSNDGRIVGGNEVSIQDHPHQAYLLLFNGTHYFECGGSIISSRHILTAAHCLVGIIRVFARVGSTESDNGGTMYSTSTFVKHPRYNAVTSDYDAAVVILPQAMTLDGTNTTAVQLPEQSNDELPANSSLVVTGWGATSEGGSSSSTLMAVEVMSHSLAECRRLLGNSTMTSRMFCAGPLEGGKDSCQGDSGGPAVLVSSKVQVGIVSFGFGCARPNRPGVYSYIASFRRWIRLVSGV